MIEQTCLERSVGRDPCLRSRRENELSIQITRCPQQSSVLYLQNISLSRDEIYMTKFFPWRISFLRSRIGDFPCWKFVIPLRTRVTQFIHLEFTAKPKADDVVIDLQPAWRFCPELHGPHTRINRLAFAEGEKWCEDIAKRPSRHENCSQGQNIQLWCLWDIEKNLFFYRWENSEVGQTWKPNSLCNRLFLKNECENCLDKVFSQLLVKKVCILVNMGAPPKHSRH